MSKEHAKKFIEHAKKDEALRRKLNEASEHIFKLAKEHGYEFSHEELQTALKEHWDKEHRDDDPPGFVLS